MRSPWILVLVAGCASPKTDSVDWRVTGGDPGNTRYSALNQIDTTNVAQLRVAWVYHAGDLPPDGHGEIQATPIVVDGVLYTTTPALAVVVNAILLTAANGDPLATARADLACNLAVVVIAAVMVWRTHRPGLRVGRT